MDLSNLFSPINYNTDVNSILLNYYTQGIGQFGPIYNFGSGSGCNSIWNFNSGYNNTYSFFNNYYNFDNLGISGGYSYNSYSGNPFMFGPIYNFTGSGDNTLISNTKTKKSSTNPTSTLITKPVKINNNKKSVNNKQNNKNTTDLNEAFVTNAFKYLGYNEKDGSSKAISDSPEWCADFVAFIVDKTYKEKGLKAPENLIILPNGYRNRRVEDLKQWGIANNKYLSLTEKSNKAEIIAQKVKVGDILILRENKASHTGFVTKVNKDGSFETIEGNRNDRVAKGYYYPDNKQISGFVQLNC